MRRATAVYENTGDNQSIESGARALGDMLTEWASQVESGVIEIPSAFASEVRSVAGVDVITKVRRLLEDKNVDPRRAGDARWGEAGNSPSGGGR